MPSVPQRIAALVCLLLAIGGTASAQYKIDAWTTEQGLPQATVHGIAQTPDGFFWIATFGGLARFDGVRFRNYDTVTNPELPNSRLNGMRVDRGGQLWVLTQDGFLLRFIDSKFVPTMDGLPGPRVRGMLIDDGRVVANTTDGGMAIWRDGRWSPYVFQDPRGAAGMTFIGIGMDRRTMRIRWYRDAYGVAHRFDGERMTRSLSLPGSNVYEDSRGRLWLAEKGDLLCVDGATTHRYSRKDGVIGVEMVLVHEDPDGTLWFGQPQGLVWFRNGHFQSFTKGHGLPANNVRNIQDDREGTHWVSTEGGLVRMTETPFVSYSTADGLAADNTYPMLQDRRGDIWIGGWPGLTRYHDGAFEPAATSFGITRNITALMEARDGVLWVGTMGQGLRQIAADRTRTITTPSALPTHAIFAIYETRSGDIWLGGPPGAIRYHDGVVDPPLPGTTLTSSFYEDDRGTLWIGRDDGLVRYARGIVTPVTDKDGFTGKRVRVIHPDARGTLWIGTYDSGLFRYRDGKFTRYTIDQGLSTNGAFEILEDAQARFWISSNLGIYRVSKAELEDVAAGRRKKVTAVAYGREDGMANVECNGQGRPAGVRAADGRLWFPTQGGVAVVNPATVHDLLPPPVTMDVLVDGHEAKSPDRVEVKFWSGAFEAQYAALTFVRPDLVKYRYRMEGIDTDWFDPQTTRMARYVGLPYGNFRFRVIAANRDGIWNEEGASIAVIVPPPFWRTTWFMALMVAAVMASAFGAHRVRFGVIERKQALQQAFARQLIDSQETDRKRIASELHDGVSQTLVVMRNWASMGENALPADHAVRRRLGEIGNAASQALGEVREVVQDLVPYHLERLGLVAAIKESAARVADASGIAITCDLAGVDGRVNSEMALRLFRVVQEGLNNMVKHSRATSASIALTLQQDAVRVTIRDDGRGFAPGSVTPTAVGDGFGLVGMSERARMMGGEMTIESAPGQGTAITIVVPCANHADSNPDR